MEEIRKKTARENEPRTYGVDRGESEERIVLHETFPSHETFQPKFSPPNLEEKVLSKKFRRTHDGRSRFSRPDPE